MLSSQLSEVKPLLTESQYNDVMHYFTSCSPNAKIKASNIVLQCKLDMPLTRKVLQTLVKSNILKCQFGIRCPECNLLLQSPDDVSAIDKEIYCYNCDEKYDISADDVEVYYVFANYPFVERQQNEPSGESDGSVVLANDSLAYFVASGECDLNSMFFAPTTEEYKALQTAYARIFEVQKNTKTTGDTLEALTSNLFNLCKHFNIASIRLKSTNQIDCYVRNKLYIPGISQINCVDSFVIECKNEAKPPKGGYMNKLHGILSNAGKPFGIIVSKCSAPKSFVKLANQIFLNNKIIIIAFDKDALRKIVFENDNLLECIARKIDEVKLNATRDLVAAGLYDA